MQRLVPILLLVIVVCLQAPIALAEPSVLDCLESDIDCLEQGDKDKEEEDSLITTENKDQSSPNKTGSIIINILKIIFALALVLLLIYILLALLKNKNKQSIQNQALENLGGLSLGQQKSIQIIRIGEKVYAIGVGNDITMLDEIKDEAVIRQLEESNAVDTQAFSFIQRFFHKNSKETKPRKATMDSFSGKLEDELHKLKSNREQLIEMNKKDDDIHG